MSSTSTAPVTEKTFNFLTVEDLEFSFRRTLRRIFTGSVFAQFELRFAQSFLNTDREEAILWKGTQRARDTDAMVIRSLRDKGLEEKLVTHIAVSRANRR